MTELQKKELTLLQACIGVCETCHLTYYLVCGSALGAVKYHGFIPWDDDIDVGMPRKDYEIFLEKAPALLPDTYFVQNYRSDPAFPAIYTKLRDSETTFLEKSSMHLPINQGIYIDIFPLDGYPQSKSEQKKLERRKRRYSLMLSCCFPLPQSPRARMLMKLLRLAGCSRRSAQTARRYEAMIARYRTEETALLCNHGNWQGTLEYAPREQYGSGTWMEFEGFRVRVPEQYDAYLTQKYGDWRAELPPEEQQGHHDFEVCDTAHPYTNYIRK